MRNSAIILTRHRRGPLCLLLALMLLAVTVRAQASDPNQTVDVSTSSWLPNPALVQQVITSGANGSDSSVPTPQNEDTVTPHWTWTTVQVYASPTGASGSFTPYTGNYVISWPNSDDTQPNTNFRGQFWDPGFYIVEVEASVRYHDDTAGTDVATHYGYGYLGGSASDIQPGTSGTGGTGGAPMISSSQHNAQANPLDAPPNPAPAPVTGGMPVTTPNVTVSPPSATFGIGASQMFTCTVSPSIDGTTVTYQWSVDGSAITGATGQTFTYSSPSPGQHTVSCAASVSNATQNYGNSSGSAMAYVIGGPITGDNDIKYACVTGFGVGTHNFLNAASGQPSNTTYSWSLSGPATFCDYDGNPVTPTTPQARFRGVSPGSKSAGDVQATVTYSLNGKSYTSKTFPITVHTPVSFQVVFHTDPNIYPPPAYGFNGQSITFQIKDGLGQPFAGADWNETWDANGGTYPAEDIPHERGGPLDNNGESEDDFSTPALTAPSDYLIGLTHTYYIGDTTNKSGCLIKIYSNVIYSTHGVSGNDNDKGTKQ